MRTTVAAMGAFELKEGSRDAVLLLDRPPGSDPAQVAGGAGATRVALVQIYAAGRRPGRPAVRRGLARGERGTGRAPCSQGEK